MVGHLSEGAIEVRRRLGAGRGPGWLWALGLCGVEKGERTREEETAGAGEEPPGDSLESSLLKAFFPSSFKHAHVFPA